MYLAALMSGVVYPELLMRFNSAELQLSHVKSTGSLHLDLETTST
jgi:hypothetical protein